MFFFWAGEKINEIDLSVGRNILFLFKSSIQLTDHFLTLPTRPHCAVAVVVASVRNEGKFLELAWAKTKGKSLMVICTSA